MKYVTTMAMAAVLLLAGCDKDESTLDVVRGDDASPATGIGAVDVQPTTENIMSDNDTMHPEPITAESEAGGFRSPGNSDSESMSGDEMATPGQGRTPGSEPMMMAALSQDEATQLAQKSGCMACHAIDSKIVGPSWSQVAERYKDDPDAKQMLIDKVKKGGRGNWDDVTGGVPMPPYSPRVPDEDIEQLVDFVLSLESA